MYRLDGRVAKRIDWEQATKRGVVSRSNMLPFTRLDIAALRDLGSFATYMEDQVKGGMTLLGKEKLHAYKKASGFRPIPVFDLRHRVTYTALSDELWGDYSLSTSRWEDYEEFDQHLLKDDFPFIAVSDVSHFYEHISHDLLCEELIAQGRPVEVVRELQRFLHHLTGRNRGLPQTYPASAPLGDLFLDIVQRSLSRRGFKVIRYNDDFRIGCATFGQATEAIELLGQLLDELHLSMSDDKTYRFSSDHYANVRNAREEMWKEINESTDGDLGPWRPSRGRYDDGGPYPEIDVDVFSLEEATDSQDEGQELSTSTEALNVLEYWTRWHSTANGGVGSPLGRRAEESVLRGAVESALDDLDASQAADVVPCVESVLRHFPAATPKLLGFAAKADTQAEGAIAEEVLRLARDGSVYLSQWQRIWVATAVNRMTDHEFGEDNLAVLSEYASDASASSYSRGAVAVALAAHGELGDGLATISELFDRCDDASRLLIGQAVLKEAPAGEQAECIRREGEVFRILADDMAND